MVKLFFLASGQLVIAEEFIREGTNRKYWKRPLTCSYEGTKIQFTSMYQYTKNEEFPAPEVDVILEDEVSPAMLGHYVRATEQFNAGKSGIVLPGVGPQRIPGNKVFPPKPN